MSKEEIYTLIDECKKGLLEIESNFYGTRRIITHEKEEKGYRSKFEVLNIQPSIVPDIYSARSSYESIQNIKKNIESRLIK